MRRGSGLSALLLLALAAGCAKDAASLTPFPCALDNSCAAGLACLPGTGCVTARADALCPASGDCSAGGAGLTCEASLGRCAPGCTDGAGCPSGRGCTSTKGAGVCLTDCSSAGVTCPAGLTCQDGWGHKACLPAGKGQGAACSGADGAACGPKGSAAICFGASCELACADGAGCPAGRVCSTAKGAGVCLTDCTSGAACTAPLTCNALLDGAHKACLAPAVGLDQPCATEGASCGPLGAAGICSGGRCQAACTGGAGCPSGRSCSAATGDGVCLVDCTAGNTCPGDLACNGPWASGKKLCVDAAAGLGPSAQCAAAATSTACGPKGLGASCDSGQCTLPCGTAASSCPAGSFCSAASGAGSCLVDCSSGQACSAGTRCSALFATAQLACLVPAVGLGKKCATESAACGPRGAGGVCTSGHCEVPCTSSAGCPAGRSCSLAGGGVCLIDCTGSGACPADLTCNGPWVNNGTSGKKFCTAPGEGGYTAGCTGQSTACGPLGLGGLCDVGECAPLCTNGQSCGSGSVCTAASGPGSCMLDCSAGQACPTGLACAALPSGAKVCTPPNTGLDSACALSDDSNCGPKGSGGVCFEGLCSPACGASGACGAGRVCSGATGGGCLADCTASQACPSGQSCGGVWHDGKSACMAAGHSVAACAGAVAQTACFAICPTSNLPVGVQCTGYTCPLNGTCAANSTCGCGAGFSAVDCSNSACNSTGSNCPGGAWWCKPNTPVTTASCNEPIAQVQTNCTCVDGRTKTRACGDIGSCEYRCSVGCDVLTQDCPAGGPSKCTLLANTATSTVFAECAQPFGANNGINKQACTRDPSDATGIGHDSCAPRFLCTSFGELAGAQTCHPLCKGQQDCPAQVNGFGASCMARTEGLASVGTCEETCRVFSPGDCATNFTCSTFNFTTDGSTSFASCRAIGSTATNGACAADTDCGIDAVCAQTHASGTANVCTPICSGGHGCPSGYTCKNVPSNYAPMGYCL